MRTYTVVLRQPRAGLIGALTSTVTHHCKQRGATLARVGVDRVVSRDCHRLPLETTYRQASVQRVSLARRRQLSIPPP